MKKSFPLFLTLLSFIVLIGGCKSDPKADSIDFIFLQINDVYEINALEGGNVGGMARVKSLIETLEAENPNTVAFLAGDFLNPSAMGTVKYEGEALKGRQMVDVMNQTGIDYVTFGNHEFDLKEHELQARINESQFTWTIANAMHVLNSDDAEVENDTVTWAREGESGAEEFSRYEILEFKEGEKSVKVGLLSVVLHDNNPDYAALGNINEDGKAAYEELKDQCDFVVAMTHLSIDEDHEFAKAIPELKLIMGGHEHQAIEDKEGSVPITKADANAKSAFVHRFSYNTKTQSLSLTSEKVELDTNIAMNMDIQQTVEKWVKIVYEGYRQQGFYPDSTVATVEEPLDGRESTNRSERTNLGTLIAGSIQRASTTTPADCGLLNSGSIRIDDQLIGAISQYDIIRILPFGGPSVTIPMKGDLLRQTLDLGTSEELMGNGGFLQYDNVEKTAEGWTVGGTAIDDNKTYQVAGTQYFFYNETKYNELFKDLRSKPEVEPVGDLQQDIRTSLIAYMQEVYD